MARLVNAPSTQEPEPEREEDAQPWADVELAAEIEARQRADAERTPPAEDEKKKPKLDTAVLIRPAVEVLADVAPPPAVSSAERDALAVSAGDLIDWMFPGGMEAWGPVYMFALTWGAIFAPRFMKRAKDRAAKEADPTNDVPQ